MLLPYAVDEGSGARSHGIKKGGGSLRPLCGKLESVVGKVSVSAREDEDGTDAVVQPVALCGLQPIQVADRADRVRCDLSQELGSAHQIAIQVNLDGL